MRRLILAFIMTLLFASGCFALSENEFKTLHESSQEFRKADAILNDTWKRVRASIKNEDKQYLLQIQKEWLKTGRDEEARAYMAMGYSKDCAYAKATRKWAKSLEVYQYNCNLSKEDQEAGRIKADDAFWDEDDNDIPEHCRAK